MFLFKSVVLFLSVALSVGFLTLLERKVLSYIQLRKGPNKVGYLGLPQPLSDALKLFTKETLLITFSNKTIYLISPIMGVAVMFILWALYCSSFGLVGMKLGVLFFLVVSSLNVYTILLSGWSSNSKYSLLGAVRAVAQTVSYEVSMAFVIINILFLSLTFNYFDLGLSQKGLWFLFLIMPLGGVWFISCLAETNRAPFDLAEGESELVSGFNVEYGSGEFALLFIAEYGSIIFMSMLSSCFFLGGFMEDIGLFHILKIVLFALLFLWVRGSFPRVRYDILMSLTWKTFLVLTISLASILISVNYYTVF